VTTRYSSKHVYPSVIILQNLRTHRAAAN